MAVSTEGWSKDSDQWLVVSDREGLSACAGAQGAGSFCSERFTGWDERDENRIEL
jgi:hypothetical protein